MAKIGEDVTKTLEEIPRRFKLIETVREKFTCRDYEKISQPPAPFHATPRGFIGPRLLATILFDKFGMDIPLNRPRGAPDPATAPRSKLDRYRSSPGGHRDCSHPATMPVSHPSHAAKPATKFVIQFTRPRPVSHLARSGAAALSAAPSQSPC